MKKPYFLLVMLLILFSQCGLNRKKSQNQEPQIQTENLQTNIDSVSNIDSLENFQVAQNQNKAFGSLNFGMVKNEVENENEKRQLLGKYNYNFKYKYNDKNGLYSIIIISDPEKALNYDSGLKEKYANLSKIITIKYGEPKINSPYPSIFEVQNSKIFTTQKWEDGAKQIHLGMKENSLDSYCVVCTIFDSNLEKEEKQRLYNLKNKDIIDASEKF